MVADLLRSTRPHQWVKNSFLFAGALFGRYAGVPVTPADVGYAALAFCCFCLLSGAAYLVNDVVDRERDQRHPVKCKRPIANGRVPVAAALAAAAGCLVLAAGLAVFLSCRPPAAAVRESFGLVVAGYVILNAGYSLGLKDVVFVDVLAISLGFVLRVVAGCVVIPVPISPWILACTLLLALFIALCKRRHELLLLGNGNGHTRKVLPKYTPELLNQMISQTSAATLVAYMLYTIQPHGFRMQQDTRMMLTVPFVVYGIWRYQYLAYRLDLGGSPEKAFRDAPFLLNGALWVLVVLALTYLR